MRLHKRKSEIDMQGEAAAVHISSPLARNVSFHDQDQGATAAAGGAAGAAAGAGAVGSPGGRRDNGPAFSTAFSDSGTSGGGGGGGGGGRGGGALSGHPLLWVLTGAALVVALLGLLASQGLIHVAVAPPAPAAKQDI